MKLTKMFQIPWGNNTGTTSEILEYSQVVANTVFMKLSSDLKTTDKVFKESLRYHEKEYHRELQVKFSGYSFVLRSPKQTANQIRRSYKNDRSIKYFRDCLFRDMKV